MSSDRLRKKIFGVEQQLKTLEMETHKGPYDVSRIKSELELNYVRSQQPQGWLIQAQRLRDAAVAVLELYKTKFKGSIFDGIYFLDIDSVYVYLMGAAIENLLKGIFVAQHPELIQLQKTQIKQEKCDGYKLHDRLKEHNLTVLARDSNINLTLNELKLIALFERFVHWAGRYRIPKNSCKFVEAQFSTYYTPDGESTLNQGQIEAFCDEVDELYSKCLSILTSHVKVWREIGDLIAA